MSGEVIIRHLDNGMRIVMEQMPHSHSVSAGLWLARGSRSEGALQNGMTHFAEHLLFKGSARRDWRAISRSLNLLGGNFNAATSTDWIKLYGHVVHRDLPDALALFAEMFTQSIFPESEVARERGVILEEILQYEDIPEDLCYEGFTQALLLPHPVGRPVIGTTELVTSFTREQLLDYWAAIMSPELMILSIAGHFDEAEVMHLANDHFARLAVPTETPSAGLDAANGHHERLLFDRDLEQINFSFGTTGPKRGQQERFAWVVYDTILGGGMGSRLFDEVREKRGLAYSIGSNVVAMHESGYLVISGSTRPESAGTAIAICREQIESLAQHGPTEDELQAAKRQIERTTLLSLENASYRSAVNAERELYGIEHLSIHETLRRLEATTAADVQQIAREVTNFGEPAICIVGPLEDAKGLEDLFNLSASTSTKP